MAAASSLQPYLYIAMKHDSPQLGHFNLEALNNLHFLV